MPIMNFIGNFGYVAVCIVGAVLAMNGKISFGVIVAFMIYIRLFTQPLSQIAQAMQSMQSAAAAAERVFFLQLFYDSPLVFYLHIRVIAAQMYMLLFGFIYLFVIS